MSKRTMHDVNDHKHKQAGTRQNYGQHNKSTVRSAPETTETSTTIQTNSNTAIRIMANAHLQLSIAFLVEVRVAAGVISQRVQLVFLRFGHLSVHRSNTATKTRDETTHNTN